ncbi:hypothetical protein GCM10018773_34510 [Streptomyces candidus]|nr:hypothetical protein GCM10018773_34510 [Streptomyces candidus]
MSPGHDRGALHTVVLVAGAVPGVARDGAVRADGCGARRRRRAATRWHPDGSGGAKAWCDPTEPALPAHRTMKEWRSR